MKFLKSLFSWFQPEVWIQTLMNQLEDQSWFQELKSKWQELDPGQQLYIKLGSIAGLVLLLILWLGSWMNHNASLQDKLNEKQDILQELKTFNQKGQSNSGKSQSLNAASNQNWVQLFKSLATKSRFSADELQVKKRRNPTTQGNQSKELTEKQFELITKKVNLKQLIRYIFHIENHELPIQIQSLNIEQVNTKGYLSGKMLISVFQPSKEG